MRGPAATREALGLRPLVEAGWADTSRIECVPLISARAEPLIFLAGRPAAEWAANAEAGVVGAFR